MTNMISIARATDDSRYPTKHEVNAMAKRLVDYYPMIKDRSSDNEWEHVAKKLMKRLSNVRSPKKAKGPPSKKPRQEVRSDVATDYDGDSSTSTIILERSPVSPMGIPVDMSFRTSTPAQNRNSSDEESCSVDIMDSQKIQARHYKTLQEIYKAKKPNKAAVTHLLNMEFESRRCFITSDVLKEQDRATKILEAYPCFRELDHVSNVLGVFWGGFKKNKSSECFFSLSESIFQVLDELQRIIQPTNSQYVSEMQNRWKTFYSKVQFYGVMKKAMKTPKTLNGVEHITAVFRALPLLFPSSTLPPKKLGSSSEALFHVLATSEDPDGFMQQRPLSSPVLIVSKDNYMIAIGKTPVTTVPMDRLNEGLLYVMAYYYVLHMTYPKCISTLLSVLQTEVLQDSIHEHDLTPHYKKAMGEWKSFSE
uniref:uncharacterized protein LOC120827894 isoform X1 n=1 Tax=Gasterosteus aculeatus aculeatus TaxID=481459 RepID=UPI001A98BB49|nr:uncharacterized protein LOC120827894 isoform X1 [Gasterosteus aculeatus aculeatus]